MPQGGTPACLPACLINNNRQCQAFPPPPLLRRLTQDVVSLEITPTIEDVFHADTSSVEEYLKQVEESTILAAIQVCVCVCARHAPGLNQSARLAAAADKCLPASQLQGVWMLNCSTLTRWPPLRTKHPQWSLIQPYP